MGALVPLAVPALDKPPVPLPAVPLPPPPQGMPELPPAPLVGHLGERPVAPLPPPRFLACNPMGNLLGVASELIECGRARYQRNELEEGREVLEKAVQFATERTQIREARYWLGETLVRLNKPAEVERLMLQVQQDDPRGELGLYAAHQLGWVSLELNRPDRALTYFDTLLKVGAPPAIISYARHGRGLALYGLKRYPEARDTWVGLLNQNAPRAVAWEGTFWLGDTLGRLGDHAAAVQRLQTFVSGGPQVLIDSGLLRLGWWSRAAGQPLEAAKAYRGLLSAYPQSTRGRVGPGRARAGAAGPRRLSRRARGGQEAGGDGPDRHPGGAGAPADQPLGDREGALRRGPRDQRRAARAHARSRHALLRAGAERGGQPGGRPGRRRRGIASSSSGRRPARPRWAPTPRCGSRRSISTRASSPRRATARGSSWPTRRRPPRCARPRSCWAARPPTGRGTTRRRPASYSGFLSAYPSYPQAPMASLALGWAELQGGKPEAARQRWTRYAQQAQTDPRAPEALVLAAELAGRAGDFAGAQTLLDQVVDRYPNSPYAEVAMLNRAILAVRGGRAADALPELGRLVQRGAVSPYVARARVTRGAALLATGKPADAERDFQAALGLGETGVAYLGMGTADFARQQWDAAVRDFVQARDAGAGPVSAAASYGLAAVLFNQRRIDEFKQAATPIVAGAVDPVITPRLLHGLAAVAVEEKRWPEAKTLTLRLADQFPRYEGTQAALTTLATAASQGEQWTLSRDMYAKLGERFPGSATTGANRLDYAEALLRTGAAAEARRALEPARGRRGRAGPDAARHHADGGGAGSHRRSRRRARHLRARGRRRGEPEGEGRSACWGRGGCWWPTASGTRAAAGSSRLSTRATARWPRRPPTGSARDSARRARRRRPPTCT